MNLMPSIGEMDLSTKKACLRYEIVNTIIGYFEEHRGDYNVCKAVGDIYSKIRNGERTNRDLSWWKLTFDEGRYLSSAIRNKTTEPDLNDTDRVANLRILELLMFSAKISILIESSDDECDDCSLESMIQLALLVEHVGRKKCTRMCSLKEKMDLMEQVDLTC